MVIDSQNHQNHRTADTGQDHSTYGYGGADKDKKARRRRSRFGYFAGL